EVVRSTGMVSAVPMAPGPAGTTSRDLRPSTVLVLIAAVVFSPSTIDSSRSNFTSTLSPSSETCRTSPERTPATCTGSPGTSPPASTKFAVKVAPERMNGSSVNCSVASEIVTASTMPTMPIVAAEDLFSFIGRAPSGRLQTRRVYFHRLTVRTVDEEVGTADVQLQERAVGADPDELLVGLGQLAEHPVEVVGALVEVGGQAAGLLDGVAQIRARRHQQVVE